MEQQAFFPPPCSWYQPHVAAGRDDMWGYVALSALVVVQPVGNGRWPEFKLLHTSNAKLTSISFCQSAWDKLPIQDTCLASGCAGGYVRLWNLKTNSVVQFHDAHKAAALPQGFSVVVQWSPKNAHLIYSVDSTGNVCIWDLARNYARAINLGKVAVTCLAVSPFEDDIIAVGSKVGNVMIVNTLGQGRILVKMRHEEEVYSVFWKPKGVWGALNSSLANTDFEEPFLISSVSTHKPSSIRVWDREGKDVAILRPVEKEDKKASKNFLPALWACDSFSGASDGETRLQLVASGRKGEIISWTESATVADEIHGLHTNYSIFGLVQCGDVLWSLSYEPIIVGWNLKHNHVEAVIPAFRGVSCLQASPMDPTRVAIGGTDHMIRVIGMDSVYPHKVSAKVPTITTQLKGKVTAVAWHPTKENRLGFGTDEGILGIYDWKADNKFVMTFDKRVNGVIYTLDWGPRTYAKETKTSGGDVRHFEPKPEEPQNTTDEVPVEEEKAGKQLVLYACGGKLAHMINPSKFSSPLINVSAIVAKSNSIDGKRRDAISDPCTDLKWSPDYSYLALGYNDGRIELYSPPYLTIRCWIKCHGRGIQFMAWRSSDFETKSDAYWFASASNDGTAKLFNLGYLFKPEFKDNLASEVHQVISSASTLNGHVGQRVISVAWSRHDPDLIVSVSYDRTAIVWNATSGERVARYGGHQHRLVGCMFHPSDPYQVITTSDELTTDFSVHAWDYRNHPYIDDIKRAAKERAQLVPKPPPTKIDTDKIDKASDDLVETRDHKADDDSKLQKVVHVAIKKPDMKSSAKKKPKKSLLPLSANALVNPSLNLEAELRFIIDKTPMLPSANGIYKDDDSAEHAQRPEREADSASVVSADGDTEANGDPAFHLGLLGTADDCVRFVQIEKEGHIRRKRWDLAFCLSNILAVGSHENIQDMVKLAIQNRAVDETLLLIASKHSATMYEEAVQAYIQQLLQTEEYYKAATYYLLLDQVDAAIELLCKKKYCREGVMIAKCTKPPELVDNTLFDQWIEKAIDGGNLELACRLCCAIGRYDRALSIIGMRNLPYAWKTGLYLAMKINDVTKAEGFGLKYLEDAIFKNNYDECFRVIEEFDILKWLMPIIFVHQVLVDISNHFEQKELYNEKTRNFEAAILEKWATKSIMEDKTFYMAKIKNVLLLAIPQNIAEAQILISKNIALMFLGDAESEQKVVKEFMVQLAHQWIQGKQPALATAIRDVLFKESRPDPE